jgi:hypothetical protein
VQSHHRASIATSKSDTKLWFESFWEKVKVQGQKVIINGRERRIHFIDHMEYIRRHAKDDCLERLRKVLLREVARKRKKAQAKWNTFDLEQ